MGWTEKVALCGLLLSCFVAASDGTGVLKVGTARCITETRTKKEYQLERGFLFVDEGGIHTEISESKMAKPFLVALPGSTSWDSASKKYPAHRLPATNAYNGVVWIADTCTPKGHSVVCGNGPSKKPYNFSFGTDCKKTGNGGAPSTAPWIMLAGTSHDGSERHKNYDISVVSVGGFFSDTDLKKGEASEASEASKLEEVSDSSPHKDTLWFTDDDVENINALEESMVNLSEEIKSMAGINWDDKHPALQQWVTVLEQTWNYFAVGYDGKKRPDVPDVTLTHPPNHKLSYSDVVDANGKTFHKVRPSVEPSPRQLAENPSILKILAVGSPPSSGDVANQASEAAAEAAAAAAALVAKAADKLREEEGDLAAKAGTLLGSLGDQTNGFWIYCVHSKLDKSESAFCDGRVSATSPGPGAPLYSLTTKPPGDTKPSKGAPAKQLMFSIRSSESFAAEADTKVAEAKKQTSTELSAAEAAANAANDGNDAKTKAEAAALRAAMAAEVAASSVTRLLSRRDLPLLMSRKVTCTLHPPTHLDSGEMQPAAPQRTLTRWEKIKESVKKPFRKHVMTPLSRGPSTLAANVKKWNNKRKDAAKVKKSVKHETKIAKKQQKKEKHQKVMQDKYTSQQ